MKYTDHSALWLEGGERHVPTKTDESFKTVSLKSCQAISAYVSLALAKMQFDQRIFIPGHIAIPIKTKILLIRT